MKKYNFQNVVIVGMFLITIFGFFTFYIIDPDKKESVLENRKLSQRPDFNVEAFMSGEYSTRFESYFNDQFPLRDEFIEVNGFLHKNLFMQSVKNDIYVSDDGYLLARVEEKSLDDARKIASKINKFAGDMKELGVSVYTALMPNKSTIMQEKFPFYFKSYGQENMDLLFKELTEVTNPIDSRQYLEDHMHEEYMFYYTDHHWQAKAAFYAYQNVMSYIIKSENMNQEKVYSYNDYQWEFKGKPFLGSDARRTTSVYVDVYDRVTVATLKQQEAPYLMRWGDKQREGLYDNRYLEIEDLYTNRYQAYLGGDFALLTIINKNKTNNLNVLVIKDSYANAFVQFLAPHYEKVHVMDLRHYKGQAIKDYVVNNNIKQIILLNNVNSIYVTPALTNFDDPGQGENQ